MKVYRTHSATICISEVRNIQYCKPGARVLKNFGAPLATKFTYKMRSGGKGMLGRGPALYKHNYYYKIPKKVYIWYDVQEDPDTDLKKTFQIYNTAAHHLICDSLACCCR